MVVIWQKLRVEGSYELISRTIYKNQINILLAKLSAGGKYF